jgi:hypothetical protein
MRGWIMRAKNPSRRPRAVATLVFCRIVLILQKTSLKSEKDLLRKSVGSGPDSSVFKVQLT